MKEEFSEIERRKAEHVQICLEKDVQMDKKTNGFEYFEFIPSAIPDLNIADIDTSCEFLGHQFSIPLLITAITGGYAEGGVINKDIARACQERGIGMGVGSQRAALEQKHLRSTFSVRSVAPDILLLGNLGLVQFSSHNYNQKQAIEAVEMIDADALAIHINALQEIVQPEGDMDFGGSLNALERLTSGVDFPIIAKEVGSGISKEAARSIASKNVAAIDVGGAGGTSWAKIEAYRHNDGSTTAKMKPFFDWGIPTAFSVIETISTSPIPCVASGGIRNGLEICKAIALGADLTGIAFPALKAWHQGGVEGVKKLIDQLALQLRGAMFLIGISSIDELKTKGKKMLVPQGIGREWLQNRQIEF
ncbi:MAG: type 2 isopentenyl-diphosphate Delta-isomerase [Candidatus Hermodarchaeota archaeon]